MTDRPFVLVRAFHKSPQVEAQAAVLLATGELTPMLIIDAPSGYRNVFSEAERAEHRAYLQKELERMAVFVRKMHGAPSPIKEYPFVHDTDLPVPLPGK